MKKRYRKSQKIQAIYFKIYGLYFKISALYFETKALCFFFFISICFIVTKNRRIPTCKVLVQKAMDCCLKGLPVQCDRTNDAM